MQDDHAIADLFHIRERVRGEEQRRALREAVLADEENDVAVLGLRALASELGVWLLIGSALVPVAAWVIFKEPLSWPMAVGYALMLAGFLVIVTQVRA